MKRLFSLLLFIVAAIVLVALAIANKGPVQLALPESLGYDPIPVPLFALLFGTLLLGMFFGGFLTWVKQGKYRKRAWQRGREVKKVSSEAEKQKKRADDLVSDIASEESSEEKAFSALGLPAPQKVA